MTHHSGISCRENAELCLTPSLRAKRSNPESIRGNILDCFVASLLAMTVRLFDS